MERERFQFLKSYADVIQNVAKADQGIAGELCLKIINYGIYGIDEKSNNPMVEALFIQIKIMIDKGQEITDKNKENGMKGGRPKNPNKTQTKPNDNPDITKIENRKEKIENRKNKIENNIEEKNIKKKFLDFVQLSEDEYQKLVDKFGKKHADESIEKLNNYLGSTGKRYKSHYFTILSWNKREGPPVKSNIEVLQERDRKRRLDEAKEILNHDKNGNATSDQNGTFNRRANLIS